MASDSKPGRMTGARRGAGHTRRGGWRDALSMDAERSSRLMLIGGVALVCLVAAGFIVFGYYNAVIKPRHRTVLAADGIEVSYSAMKRRMGYELIQNPVYAQSQQALQLLPDATYQTLLNEITIVSRADDSFGVTMDGAEFDQKFRARLGVSAEADQRAFADALRRELKKTGLQEGEYRRMVRADLLETRIRDKITSELPASAPQVKLEVIAAETEEAANQAIARVQAGESWLNVAKELSRESDAPTTGGVKDYAPEGLVNTSYQSFAFTAAAGEISKPLPSDASVGSPLFYVVRVIDRADRPITEQQKPDLASQKFNNWLVDTQHQMDVVNKWDVQAQTDALISVFESKVDELEDRARQQQEQPVNVQPVQPPQQQPPSDAPPADSSNPPADDAPVAPGGGDAP